MPSLDVLIQNCADGRVIARVPDLWGCHVIARGRQPALELLDAEVPDYLEWRKDIGHPVSLGRGKRSLVAVEECHVESEEDVPGDTPIFDWDRRFLSESDLREASEVCTARIRQLESLAIDLHPRVLAWVSRDLDQSVESVLETLESWLAVHLSQLGSHTINPETPTPLDRLNATFANLKRVLEVLDEAGRNRKYTMPGNCGQRNEDWTIRKLLRRMAECETSAVRTIRQVFRDYQAG